MSEFKVNPFDMPYEDFYPRMSFDKSETTYSHALSQIMKYGKKLGIKKQRWQEEHTDTKWIWTVKNECN